jgi:hypothetical protein
MTCQAISGLQRIARTRQDRDRGVRARLALHEPDTIAARIAEDCDNDRSGLCHWHLDVTSKLEKGPKRVPDVRYLNMDSDEVLAGSLGPMPPSMPGAPVPAQTPRVEIWK